MRLTEHLFLVGSGDMGLAMTHPLDCNVYLVDLGGNMALIDSGLGIDPDLIVSQMVADGADPAKLTHLFLTHGHADHMGGAAWFRQRYGLTVIAPEPEAEFIQDGNEAMLGLDVARNAGYYPAGYRLTPCPVDCIVRKGQVIQLGETKIEIYEASGHSVGGVCYYMELDNRKMLFTGDLLAYGGRISLQNIPGADVHAYSRSVLALRDLEVDSLLPGHLQMLMRRGKNAVDAACSQFLKLGVPPNLI